MKIRNIRQNSNVTMLIDSAGVGLKLRAVLMRGTANLIEGTDCKRIEKTIYDKYLPGKLTRTNKAAAAFKKLMTSDSDSSICIQFIPRIITTWDYGKMNANDVRDESEQASLTRKPEEIFE